MNDATPFPDDELVSAHLDGEATPTEDARVRAEAPLRLRHDEFTEMRNQVAQTVKVPESAREDAIAAALRVFDDEIVPDLAPSAPMPNDISAQRARKNAGRQRGPASWLAAAAAVAVVLFGAGVMIRATRSTQNATDTASVAVAPATPSTKTAGNVLVDGSKRAQDRASSSGAGAPESNPSAPATSTTSAGRSTSTQPPQSSNAPQQFQVYVYRGTLGAISSPEQLRSVVGQALTAAAVASEDHSTATTETGAPTEAAAKTAGALSSCDARLRNDDHEIGAVTFSASAVYQGTDAIVLMYDIDLNAHPAANGSRRIYTVNQATCSTLDVQTV